MEKAEFSETQFVIGYTKELFNSNSFPITFFMPSTREEKQWASDLVIRHYSNTGRYKYSEFYQFKRSKFYNGEVFDSLKSKITVDTSVKSKYGFSIYNSKKTKQFNVLQKLAKKPRCRAYYCAPLFHTISEFNNYFSSNSIINNSKVFPILQSQLQSIRIPLNSNHQIIFDRSSQYICSDPSEILGLIASERESYFASQEIGSSDNLTFLVEEVYKTVLEEIPEEEISNVSNVPINFFEVRELLINYFDVYWQLNDFN